MTESSTEVLRASTQEEIQPLVELCKAGKLFEVQDWIAAGKVVNPPLYPNHRVSRRGPLEIALEKGFHSLVKVLLDGRAAIESTGYDGPVEIALHMRRLDLIQLFVEHGYDPKSINMESVFHSWNPEIMEYFVEHGADVETGNPLASAFCSRIRTALRIFKQYKARYPSFQEQANIALRHHCREGNMKWVSLMLWAGADPYVPGTDDYTEQLDDPEEEGLSALGFAALRDNFEVFRLKKVRLDPTHPVAHEVMRHIDCEDGFEVLHDLLQKGMNPNDQETGGAARGTSLLAGRVLCGRCGRRMSISYSGQSKARFTCDGSRNQWGTAQCQALNARSLRELVERQLLLAVSPASVELSLNAAREIESDRKQVERHHLQNVERSRYKAELARRRYEEVDPSNRLVAVELERRWEAALIEQHQAEEILERFRLQQPVRVTSQEESRIKALSSNIPKLWHAETTSGIDRQRILRALIEQIQVEVVGESERVQVTIRWAGGFESHHEIRRAVCKFEKLESAEQIRSRVVELKQQGYTHQTVAEALNTEGFRAASGGMFTTPIISQLCRKFRQAGLELDRHVISSNQWKLGHLAQHLGIKPETLSTWRRRGWVHAMQVGKGWVLWADAEELNRLKQLADYQRQGLKRTPANLTTPKRS